MGKYQVRGTVLFLLSAVFAQALLSPPHSAYAQDMPDYAPGELQQLVAPIALYPDPLLGEVLMASTYPEEVAAAAQWRNANPGISGDYLTAALEQQPWDPSIKGLTEFPDVLQMMNNNLDWTEKLGEAFLADDADVTNAVQQLRHEAQGSGALASGPQETVADDVSDQGDYITIEPTDPAQVYVPYYNPVTVFSSWPYPAYAPYVFAAPNGVVYVNNGLFGYFGGVFVVDALWGWDTWNWHDHYIHIDRRHWKNLDNGQRPPAAGAWHYDPVHRHDVPYKNAAVRARFENAPAATLNAYRGYERNAAAPMAQVSVAQVPAVRTHSDNAHPYRGYEGNTAAPVAQAGKFIPTREARSPEGEQSVTRPPEARPQEARQPEAAAQPRPPALFESFAPGPQVRTEQNRGSASMHAPPAVHAPPPARQPPPARDNSQKDQRK